MFYQVAQPIKGSYYQTIFFQDHQNKILIAKANAVKDAAQKNEPVYVQPRNKKNPCKLPYATWMTEEPGFTSYWDGSCSKGMASGFGLDVAKSDIGRYEELTANANSNGGLTVLRDYVRKETFRGRIDSKNKTRLGLIERLTTTDEGQYLRQYSSIHEDLKNLTTYSRTFDSTNAYTLDNVEIGGVGHMHLHFNAVREDLVTDIWQYTYHGISKNVLRNQDNGTVIKVRQANGFSTDLLRNNGQWVPVTIRDQESYWGPFNAAYREFDLKLNEAMIASADANHQEEQYDYKIRSGRSDKSIPKDLLIERSNYYKDFLEKERISIDEFRKEQQEIEDRIRQNQLYQAELQRIEAERRAAKKASMEAADFAPMLQVQPFQIQIPTFTPPQVQPLTINRPNVYTTQRITDNMTLIRKVR